MNLRMLLGFISVHLALMMHGAFVTLLRTLAALLIVNGLLCSIMPNIVIVLLVDERNDDLAAS